MVTLLNHILWVESLILHGGIFWVKCKIVSKETIKKREKARDYKREHIQSGSRVKDSLTRFYIACYHSETFWQNRNSKQGI